MHGSVGFVQNVIKISLFLLKIDQQSVHHITPKQKVVSVVER